MSGLMPSRLSAARPVSLPLAASSPGGEDSVTTPVSVRFPSGTRTRAPTTGSAKDSGTEYVRASSEGTGTATRTRRMAYAPGDRGGTGRPSSMSASFRSSQASRL